MDNKISSALISVFCKDGLDVIIQQLDQLGVRIYTTGGTQEFIESLGISVIRVEDLTGYPSILDGRVKTLHPKVFGGILAKRSDDHLTQLTKYDIPPMDLVIVDLYPFEETVLATDDQSKIIEKIDIGGISLIRAAAKNFHDVTVISSKDQYQKLYDILTIHKGVTTLQDRQHLAAEAFKVSSHYDTAIFQYLADEALKSATFKHSIMDHLPLRYGENPHQTATFFGNLDNIVSKLCGKELSYNNLVDIDAAISLMFEFRYEPPTMAILKHTNACGVATRQSVSEAWQSALAADPVSAFGGILIANSTIDLSAAELIDQIFYEVLIAPDFTPEAEVLLRKKAKRVLLKLHKYPQSPQTFRSLINGVIVQDADRESSGPQDLRVMTKLSPNPEEISDLLFAEKCAKHLKSNTIVLVRDKQLLGMGCGQTSRVDACAQAIAKAKKFGFSLIGAVMASDAFFPFPDCVELVYHEGIKAVIQPGGSIKDQYSIDYCDQQGMSMVFTGSRHFRH
ncbi:MAG: bifunctional phosphoribosylaminoimidazolecarboxamide formyltransferase/IMP cyclohydrolase [Saprospiraceae bacterium]